MNTLHKLYKIYSEHPSISTDSRKVKEGDIFFALSGPTFDGNNFALTALAQGAVCAVVSRPELSEADERCLLVPDTLQALQELAHYHRQQLNIPVVAITGTNGKTTTKELTATLLAERYQVLATEGNLNNHIGVPLTLLRIRPEHEVAIVEMGASGKGEIAQLCEIAEPTVGLITNIGRAHLEGFGSQEGILEAKSELPEYLLSHGGTFFLNLDDPLLRSRWESATNATYSKSGGRVRIGVKATEPTLSFELEKGNESVAVQTHLVGLYNIENILAALHLADYLGISLQEMKSGMEGYTPSNNRSQLVELGHGSHLILDAYNANPSSMHVALEGLAKWQAPHKLAILGDMRELGEASQEEHSSVVHWLKGHPEVTPILVGHHFQEAAEGLFTTLPDVEALIIHLKGLSLEPETIILLKGSRGIALEKAVPALKQIKE